MADKSDFAIISVKGPIEMRLRRTSWRAYQDSTSHLSPLTIDTLSTIHSSACPHNSKNCRNRARKLSFDAPLGAMA
jgi:hypothetical protein